MNVGDIDGAYHGSYQDRVHFLDVSQGVNIEKKANSELYEDIRYRKNTCFKLEERDYNS